MANSEYINNIPLRRHGRVQNININVEPNYPKDAQNDVWPKLHKKGGYVEVDLGPDVVIYTS